MVGPTGTAEGQRLGTSLVKDALGRDRSAFRLGANGSKYRWAQAEQRASYVACFRWVVTRVRAVLNKTSQ